MGAVIYIFRDWLQDSTDVSKLRLHSKMTMSLKTTRRCHSSRPYSESRQDNPNEGHHSEEGKKTVQIEKRERAKMEEQTNPSNDTAEQSVPKQETTFEEEETSPPQGTSTEPLTQIADALSKLLVARSPREIDVSPYDGTFEAQSFFDNFDAQADRAELTYTDRLRKLPCYLQDLFPATTEASFARFLAIKLTPQMSLEDYYQNKTVMGMKLNLPTDILIESLTDGLPVADQRLIATVQPNTIKEWFDLVVNNGSHRAEHAQSTAPDHAQPLYQNVVPTPGPRSNLRVMFPKSKLQAKTTLQAPRATQRIISRRLVANDLHSCRPLRRLPLTPPNRRQRLEWCRARSTWMTEWHRVVFSDESRFCLSSDSRRVRVWRRRGERSNPAAIVERPTVRQRGIMVWGAIAYDSRSPLLRIQGTMTAQRYVDDVLRPVTLPYLQGVPNALYQQDNARPHTARISQQALQDVQMLPWPPYSPDLSPIEHVWDIIGRRLHALPQPRSEDELWQMVEREWRAIPQDAIRFLIDSLPRRVAACIAVRGGPTCY
ncbi:Transposase [Cordylochernes scorpioides]|uniref:Transposase n=1 Tax=Cordylochernes scorpioides TaxID=51811 RepID=A0ABY6LER4_9ARAC|nr:Transposase [Cordylochernes scorpioides]